MDIAFKYVKDAGGIDTEASYPYTAKDGNCTYDPKNSGATLTSWVDIPHNSEAVSSALAHNSSPLCAGPAEGCGDYRAHLCGNRCQQAHLPLLQEGSLP